MTATAVESDLFEWTVTDAPLAESPAERWIVPGMAEATSDTPFSTEAVRQAVSFFRSVSGVLIAAVGVVLLTVWLTEGWQQWVTEQTVRNTFAREEQAALAGDVTTLLALSSTGDRIWLEQRLERAANDLFAPSPLHGLRPIVEAGQLQTITQLQPDLFQVEVARRFATSEGQSLTFILPQFYQRVNGGWVRGFAPDSYWGAPMRLAGRYIEINGYALDRDFAIELLPHLDDVLARFCQRWGCANQPPITVDLANRYYQWPDMPELRPGDPLLFSVLPPHVTRFPEYALLVPSPHDVGFPADDAARDLLHRAIGVQVLFAAMDRLAFSDGRRDAVGNSFFFALVVRESVRLDLDPASVLTGPPLATPERLTAQRYWDFRGGVWRRPDVIRNTLVMMNDWLAENDARVDTALLRGIGDAASPAEWLAVGAGLSLESAQAKVDAAIAQLRTAP
ncbi:MAG: hypothetical protein ACT4QE_16040 [Anaerolineales bacterium]